MEVLTVFDQRTPQTVRATAEVLRGWTYDLPLPTDDARCLGFILEQSIAFRLRDGLPEHEVSLGGATEYPNLTVVGHDGRLAFEVKAAPRTSQISNRVKSPEPILRFYPAYDGHWVIALFYSFDEDGVHLRNLHGCLLELWQYSAAAFKDMSALCALGSLDRMLRRTQMEKAFGSEQEFLDFCTYMSSHPGTTAQRNAAVREWLRQRRVT